jgi:S-formylglutathione hydrolase
MVCKNRGIIIKTYRGAITLKYYNVFPLRLFFAFIFGLIPITQTISQQVVNDDKNLIFVKIPAPSLANNLLSVPTEQKIAICTPPDYYRNEEIRFPTVYFLTGYVDEAVCYTNEMYQGLKMHESLRALVEKKTIKDMIIVIVDCINFLGGGFYSNSEVGGNWEDFIFKDVVGYMDAKYRTIARPDARGIAGHSMGGFGALNIAIKHPDIFGSVFALSPGLFDKTGLENSPMFSNPYMVEKFLKCEGENKSLARDKAHERLLNYCDNTRDEDMIFTLAYGMAFAPNKSKNAPYIDYPYPSAKGVQNKDIWKKWEDGFGSWDDKVKTYKENILKLKNIQIEYGLKEEDKWRINGCKYLVKLLTAEKLPIKLVTFNGGHNDKLRERIEQSMLPFFSNILLAK